MNQPPEVIVLDDLFLEESSVIANYLLPSNDGLILIETGPETTFNHLKAAIADKGFDWKAVKHVILTHIHFDHAGAAWKFAENGARIYVHPVGLPHLNNPEKLWNSAKRIYKDDMERLWGEMKPIEKDLLIPVDDRDVLQIGGVELTAFYTPGHAVHHNAYQLGKVIFTGDVAGVRINEGPVTPPCPPPDINIEAWKKSIQKLRNLKPERLYLAHFGPIDRPEEHLSDLEIALDDWKDWMKAPFDKRIASEEITPEFVAYSHRQLKKADVSDEDISRYEKANPSFMSVTGLMRYWKLREQGRIS